MADIMNTGEQSYRDLREENNKNQGIAQDTDSIQVIQNPFTAGEATLYQGNMTTPQRRQSSAGVTPFGESYWDPEGMVNDYQLEHLENIRANNQSGLAQIGNGLLKMTTTALTTLADGTIGALYGVGQGIANLVDNDEKTGFWQGMWDNDFNRAMATIQENMEEIAPNYYTDEQRNSPWYSAANILSANFLGDKLLKNAGFTIGAMASLAVPGFDMAWLAKGVTNAAKGLGASASLAGDTGAIANYLARTFVSANSEASIEAINAVKDNQKAMYEGIQQRADESARESENQMRIDILSGVDENTAQANHIKRLNAIDQEAANAKAYADEQLRDVGNSVWLMNTGLLSITNSLEFGNILKGGYNLRKSLKDYGVKLTAEGQEVGAREFGQALARGAKTEMTPDIPKIDAMGIVGGTLQRFGSESFEEGAQRIISDSNQMQAQAKLQEWADSRYNKDSNKYSLWEKQINPDVTADLVDYTKALANAWKTGFGTLASSGWEEVFLGGLTGMFGTAGIRRKADGQMGIGWQGGIYESIKDQQAKYTEADKMIQAFNDQLSKPEFKDRMQHSAAALAAAYDMEEALNNGDIMGYKNGEMLAAANDAIYFRDNGMLDLFKGYYEETAKNVSDETINNLRSQTKDVKTGKSFYDGKSNDEIRQMIQDKSKSTLDKIENTVKIYEDMERQYSEPLRAVDTTSFINDIKDPVVRANVALSGADYAQRGVQQLTYLSALYDDLNRRKGELEQEKTTAESSIDGKDKVKQIDKDIKEIDTAITDIQNQFNKAKNNPEEMVQEMIDAQVKSAKVAIGKEAEATKARYHNASSLQDVADTFLYGDTNQAILEQAIHEAKDEDNKKLLESFYPFAAEVNAVEGAINSVVEESSPEEADEVKNRAKAALGTFAQEAINETLSERADTGTAPTIASKLRDYAKAIVEGANKEDPIAMVGAESTSAFLNDVADRLDKARTTAKVPKVKPIEEHKKKAEEETKPEPEAGKKGEPQDAAQKPEPAKKPEVKPQPKTDTGEVEITPVTKTESTPSNYKKGDSVFTDGAKATIDQVMGNGVYEVKFSDGSKQIVTEKDITSQEVKSAQEESKAKPSASKNVGDTITMTDGFMGTIKSIPKAGVYEVEKENGETVIATDADFKTESPETNTQSSTGGNNQPQPATPIRKEGQGNQNPQSNTPTLQSLFDRMNNAKSLGELEAIENEANKANIPEDKWASVYLANVERVKVEQQRRETENPLEVLLPWAEGTLPTAEAVEQLKGTEYVETKAPSKVLNTAGGTFFTKAVERELGNYLTSKYPFLTVEGVTVNTGVSTVGGDMGLLVVKDSEGNEYGSPSNFIRSLATGGKAVDVVAKGLKAEEEKEQNAGKPQQETRIVEPETPEQEERKEEVRSGKSFTATNFLTYEQSILGRRRPEDKGVAKRRQNKSVLAFQELLKSKGIDIDHVVNNYMYDIMTDGKLPVRYMVMRDSEGKVTPTDGSEHIFIITPVTDKIQELAEEDNILHGNIKQMNDGSKMLVVGILGYGEKDTDLANRAEQIREIYRNMDEQAKAKEYTMIPNLENSIYAINGGQMVLQFEGQEKGDTDLKLLLGSDDRNVNPRKLTIGDIRFATAIGMEGNVTLKFFQAREGDDVYGFLNPLSLQGSPGNVWMFIRSADGKFIPTPIAPTTWGDNNMNWDSELGRKIRSLIDSLATVKNKEDIPALLKELNQRLIFSINNRNMGNRLFYDEKTGELTLRRFNLDAVQNTDKVLVQGSDELGIGEVTQNLTLNLLNTERSMDESKQLLYQMIETLDPVINIQNSVMASAGGIKTYLNAGLFKVGIKSLGVVNAKTYMYPLNDHLEPISTFTIPPAAPMTNGNLSTFYYNGNRYAFSGDKLYDSNFNEITDSDIIENIRAAASIQSGTVRPVRVNNKSYWEIGGKVYSEYRNGGYAQLSLSEEREYKQRKAAEAEKKAKEQAAREEAARLEQFKNENAKYKVGDVLNGREIKEVNVVDNEIVYTFSDTQNGIQSGTISQTELDTLLSQEQQREAASQQQEVQQGETDSKKDVKKTEQESKTLAQKVQDSKNNATFTSLFKGPNGRATFNSLVSAVNNALQKAGEASKQFKGTKALEDELISRGITPPTDISELQALVQRLNECGF